MSIRDINVTFLRILVLIIFLIPLVSYSNPIIANGFFITNKTASFHNKTGRIKCSGEIPYPYLSNSDEELFITINNHIENFVERYAICNQGNRNHYSVSYEVPESKNKDFFSVLWVTKRYDKVVRIDTINFNAENGTILRPEGIFHIHSNNLIHEIIKLSKGHLGFDTTWEDFLNKIESRDIQLYLEDNEWYIIFNTTPAFETLFKAKLPRYFLQQRQKHG
ncbi:MAG TPA: hypothetical protein QKA08_02170 [Candidatus Megaira endosymbiont of Nemacystus decipiens]|nr:hypothetical protein [Candidatus Megaera endosymbiont of Nemacystus decipiens]